MGIWAWVAPKKCKTKDPLEASGCCWGPVLRSYKKRAGESLAVCSVHADGPFFRLIQTWQKWKVWACPARTCHPRHSTIHTRLTLKPFTIFRCKWGHAGLCINCYLDKCEGFMNSGIGRRKWEMVHSPPSFSSGSPSERLPYLTHILHATSGTWQWADFKTQEVLLIKGSGLVSQQLLTSNCLTDHGDFETLWRSCHPQVFVREPNLQAAPPDGSALATPWFEHDFNSD